MFNIPYKGALGKKEELSSKTVVETAGYVSAERRIMSLIRAGQQLDSFRKEQFDFADGQEIDENFYDPTREPGYDLADASMALNDLNNKQQAKELEKASQTAQEALEELPNDEAGENPVE